MSAESTTAGRDLRRFALPALLALVAIAAVLSTKRVPISTADQVDPDAFDPTVYAAESFDEVVAPYVEANAHELGELLTALDGGADPAEYGNAPGAASSFSFPVRFVGTAEAIDGNLMPIEVEGVADDISVVVQVGPALNGTALRDVSGTISFNEFTNQLEYQEIGTELNNLVRSGVLSSLDREATEGRTFEVTGAFTRVNPALVSIVPTTLVVVES